MAYDRTKIKEVILLPYEYWGIESGFKEVQVFVIKGDESPDPSKLMLWGKTKEGGDISDFKKYFTRAGKPIKITYKTEGWTGHQEREDMLKAVERYLKGK